MIEHRIGTEATERCTLSLGSFPRLGALHCKRRSFAFAASSAAAAAAASAAGLPYIEPL